MQHFEPQHFDRRSLQAVHTALARASMAAGAPLAEVVIESPGAGAMTRSIQHKAQLQPHLHC